MNLNKDEDKGSKYDEYLKEPTEDYYREYESASVCFYESTEDMHIFNKKEYKLNEESFNEWKNFFFLNMLIMEIVKI